MATGTSMSDEQLDADPIEDDDEDLDLDDEDDLDLDDDVDVDTLDDEDVDDEDEDEEEEEEDGSPVAAPERRARTARRDDDEEAIDLDEELHPDDVEEPLDVVLRERTASPDEEEEEEEDDGDEGADATGGRRITPRSEDEFLCQSCFLVLPRNQLADEEAQLCRDCV